MSSGLQVFLCGELMAPIAQGCWGSLREGGAGSFSSPGGPRLEVGMCGAGAHEMAEAKTALGFLLHCLRPSRERLVLGSIIFSGSLSSAPAPEGRDKNTHPGWEEYWTQNEKTCLCHLPVRLW